MKIKFLLFLFSMAASVSAGDILRINYADSTSQDFEISTIERLTFVDYENDDNYMIRINRSDGMQHDDNINTVSMLRFSDFTLVSPENLTIIAGSTLVRLIWDNVTNATDYLIYRSETGPYAGFVKTDSTYNRIYYDYDVRSGNKYFYKIKARN